MSAGGLINVAVERDGYDEGRARAIAARVYQTTLDVFETAQRLGISTAEAALHLVEERIAAARVA